MREQRETDSLNKKNYTSQHERNDNINRDGI